MLQTLAGMFLVGVFNKLRNRKRTNRKNQEQKKENPRKMGKSQQGQYQPSGPAEVQCEFFGPISGLNFGR